MPVIALRVDIDCDNESDNEAGRLRGEYAVSKIRMPLLLLFARNFVAYSVVCSCLALPVYT